MVGKFLKNASFYLFLYIGIENDKKAWFLWEWLVRPPRLFGRVEMVEKFIKMSVLFFISLHKYMEIGK